MLLTPAALDSAFIGFHKMFQDGFVAATPFWDKLATKTTSDTESETYHHMLRLPRMREWLGERVYNNLASASYNLVNRDFEQSEKIPRNKFEDDKFGIYAPMFKMIGEAVSYWPDDLVMEALLAGGSSLCYDGQYFFDTDHPKQLNNSAGGTQSNLYTTTALTAANFGTTRAAMRALVGEDGKPLKVRPNLLVVPPALEKTAREIVVATTVPSAAGTASQTNTQAGQADVLVIDELAAAAGGSDTTWYLMDTTKAVKPFIFQERKAPTFTFFDKPTDATVFERREFRFGAESRGAAGYALWFLAAKCTA